jgi:hypothetical protein
MFKEVAAELGVEFNIPFYHFFVFVHSLPAKLGVKEQ